MAAGAGGPEVAAMAAAVAVMVARCNLDVLAVGASSTTETAMTCTERKLHKRRMQGAIRN